MSKHTPGPYRVSRGRRGKLGQSQEEMTPFISIATNWPGNGPDAILCEMVEGSSAHKFGGPHDGTHFVRAEEVEANAHLFAAAPDLLDALERLVHMAECNTVPGPNTLEQARAAIAAARIARGGES